MVITLPIIVLLTALLLLSASFSATEAAMLAINKVRLRHLAEQGHRGAQLTFTLLTQMDQVIGTLLLANNLVNVAISAIGSWIFVTRFGAEKGLLIATGVIAVVLLFLIAKFVIRLVIRLLLSGLVIMIMLIVTTVGWWNGWFASSSSHKTPRPAASRRANSR